MLEVKQTADMLVHEGERWSAHTSHYSVSVSYFHFWRIKITAPLLLVKSCQANLTKGSTVDLTKTIFRTLNYRPVGNIFNKLIVISSSPSTAAPESG